jgi:PadR family transcriptional regulator PadR
MPKSESCGQFEQLVLTAIASLADNAYGITIHDKVQELSRPKSVTLGAIYVTLDRMEDKGFLSSLLSDPTPERGGRSKRFYRLEKAGVRILRESAVVAQRICETLAHTWGKA